MKITLLEQKKNDPRKVSPTVSGAGNTIQPQDQQQLVKTNRNRVKNGVLL